MGAVPNVNVLQKHMFRKEEKAKAIPTYVENWDEEPVEKCDAEARVGRSPPRSGKRGAGEGDLTPVKSENTHGQTMVDSKELVDLGIVRSHPANPRKARESA